MKKNLSFSHAFALAGLLGAGSLFAADTNPKDDVTAAATALGNESSYSWRTTVDAGANARFRPGPTEGKTEKDGYTTVSFTFNDNTTQVVMHGTNAAVKTPDNDWQTTAEMLQDNGPGAFMARMVQGYKAPAGDVARLVGETTDLKAGDKGITGDLTEDGAKSMLTFRRGGNGGPTVTNPKGSVTFWLTDGKLVKYQTHVTGTVSFNGNDRDVDRTSTTEIKDVGTTKVEVSDEAKKKLQ